MIQEQRPTEIAHVLFLDIVGYSSHPTSTQSRLIADLTSYVNSTETYQKLRTQRDVLPIPTGDGMALLFFNDVLAPAQCAVELSRIVKGTGMALRMGVHSGLVRRQPDIRGGENVVGEGINTAQRVMAFADDGHILLSSKYADWLTQFDDWPSRVTKLGEAETKHGERLSLFNLHGEDFGRSDPPSAFLSAVGRSLGEAKSKAPIVLLYRRNTQPDDDLLNTLEAKLGERGFEIFVDRHLKIGVEWAKAIEQKIRQADAVVAILSDRAVASEMLEYELETAYDEYGKRGRPHILPIRIGSERKLEGPIGALVNGFNFAHWEGASDNDRIVSEITAALLKPVPSESDAPHLEPAGGAVSADSTFYVTREADREFLGAISANESIILVKGPRQVGKTSLIGRGAKLVKELCWRHSITDFQKLSASQLVSEDMFYRVLAATLARQLKFKYDFENEWLDVFGANLNMENFVRAALEESADPLVWFMDEADKLFGVAFASDFFGLVRSWHNSRATEPDGPWERFTIVISYATEAHLFIQDLNQSPFNVGRHIKLSGFSEDEVSDLNNRYGKPLKPDEVRRLYGLVAGQPFLTRRALDIICSGRMSFETLVATADRDDGPFGDHLKRILVSVSQVPSVLEAMRNSLSSNELKDTDGFQRLLAAGVIETTSDNQIQLRCELYRRYLGEHISGKGLVS